MIKDFFLMDVSIIIVNYNTLLLTSKCIGSIFDRTNDVDFEVIVVDNCSTDGSIEAFSGDSRISFVPLSKNLGFGMANNEGFKIAKGKYVFCLNPDTILLNNAIKILFNFMETQPNAGVCGGNLYDCDMNPTHSYRMTLPSIWWEIDCHLRYFFGKIIWGRNLEFNHTDKPRPVGYITGADMMVRKEMLEIVGGFSKHFFMYYEECELTYRIRKAGYEVYSVPDAKIQHLEGKSFKTSDLTWKEKCMINSKWMYRKLCYPSPIYKMLRYYSLTAAKFAGDRNPKFLYVKELLRKIQDEK